VFIGGVTTEAIARGHASRQFPLQGRLVDVGGRRIQMDCRGSGAPTVVLESGLDVLGSLSWAAVHDSLAAVTRVCAYSRAGIMWSDPSPLPFSAVSVAHDLHAALQAAGESMPVVLVAHSLGGPYALEFTRTFGDDVVGLVLVDASHPEQVERTRLATGVNIAPPSGLVSFGAVMARTGLVRVLAGEVGPPSAPAVVRATASAYTPQSVAALAAETRAVPATFAATRSACALGGRPLVVLTAMAPMPAYERAVMHLTDAQVDDLVAVKRSLQDDEATWSTRSRHDLVAGAGHYIQFEQPGAVIAAVRNVVSAVRAQPQGGTTRIDAR
jgi:pimeloyl-ACP methyl ester carboxylesterase